MAAIRKFLFEHSFDPAEEVPEPAPAQPAEPEPEPEPTFTLAELEAAREAAREEGHMAGLAEGRAAEQHATERLSALAMNQIATELGRLADTLEGMRGDRIETAAALGLGIARRLLPETARRHGLDEVAAMIQDCLAELRDEPRIVVRVGPVLADAVAAHLTRLAEQRGFGGALSVVVDEGLGPSDAQVEWSDGSASRDEARFWADVDAAAQRILAGV